MAVTRDTGAIKWRIIVCAANWWLGWGFSDLWRLNMHDCIGDGGICNPDDELRKNFREPPSLVSPFGPDCLCSCAGWAAISGIPFIFLRISQSYEKRERQGCISISALRVPCAHGLLQRELDICDILKMFAQERLYPVQRQKTTGNCDSNSRHFLPILLVFYFIFISSPLHICNWSPLWQKIHFTSCQLNFRWRISSQRFFPQIVCSPCSQLWTTLPRIFLDTRRGWNESEFALISASMPFSFIFAPGFQPSLETDEFVQLSLFVVKLYFLVPVQSFAKFSWLLPSCLLVFFPTKTLHKILNFLYQKLKCKLTS